MSTPETNAGETGLPGWGAGEVPAPKVGPALAAIVVVIAVVGLGLGLIAPITGIVGAGLLLIALSLWVGAGGRAILRDAGARRLQPHEAPRFDNVAGGLASDLGMAKPGLWICEEGGPNAFVAWSGGPQLGITRALLDGFTRTEVEAVVAHCLVRVATGEARATTIATALGPLPTGNARVGGPLDVAAAAVTRYPPALASAIEKSVPRSGRAARAWFVAEGPSHIPAAERSAALEDL